MPREDKDDDYEEIGFLTPDDVSAMEAIENSETDKLSYIESVAHTFTWVTKHAFVYSAKYLGASFVAVAIVPKAVPHIARYFAPSLGGAPGVAAATATVAFASGTVGLTGEVSRQMAEGIWGGSTSFIGYLFNAPKKNSEEIIKTTATAEKRKSKHKKSRN